jgi:ankyrin repeat protein
MAIKYSFIGDYIFIISVSEKKHYILKNILKINKDFTKYRGRNYHYLSAIHIASYNNDIETIKILLANGDLVEKKNDRGDTPLIEAIRGNSYNAVKYLIDVGADVNFRSRFYYSPLNLAIKNNNYEIVDILVIHGAKSHGIDNKSFNEYSKKNKVDKKIIESIKKYNAVETVKR